MTNYDKALDKLISSGYEFKFQKYLQDGFELYKTFTGQYAAFYLIVFAFSFLTSMINDYVGIAIDIVLTPVLTAGALLVANELIRGHKPEFGFFFKGFDFFAPLVVLNIVSAILILVGFVFLIIPGIYLWVAYSFANMFIIFLKYDYWSALEYSRKIIAKNWWQFFGFIIVLGMINVAGFLFCGIGIIFTVPATFCMQFCAFEDIIGGAIKRYQYEQNSQNQNRDNESDLIENSND